MRLLSITLRRILLLMLFVGMGLSVMSTSPKQAVIENDGKAMFQLECTFGKDKSLTGIMVLKLDGDTLRGSVVNEFGIRAFDLEGLPGKKKLKISNVINPLDKWYIRRSLSRDLVKLINSDSATYVGKRASYSLSILKN